MKKLVQAFSMIGLLVALMISAQAQSGKRYLVQIPFDFSIGQESYQAGTYQLSLTGNKLLIRNQKTNASRILLTSFEEKGKAFEKPHFYFKRDGSENILTEIAGKDFFVKVKTPASAARDLLQSQSALHSNQSDPPAN